MLSILIPVFEFDVVELVKELSHQSMEIQIEYEIICIDDKSSREILALNAPLEFMRDVKYVKSPENLGRSVVRNRLASMASYPYLLFMDCDSLVTRKNYISSYIKNADPNVVIYGGRCYDPTPPQDRRKYLRWLYGTRRETTTAAQRNKYPYKSFMTNNLLIPKDLYMKIRMNESIKGYGHEDTAFGKQLKVHGIPVKHIDNPLCHIGLENAEDFLTKTEEGIRNLTYLIRNKLIDDDVKLYKYYLLIRRLGLLPILRKSLINRRQTIYSKLISGNPTLRQFDIYKLICLVETLHEDVSDN